ncbi:MAG TPA: GntR family transcriptional regulator [Caulobacteraceae bacterium]|jgi:DNA-binding FadR family transcriptional regulator
MTRATQPTGERIYAAIKRQILRGDFRPGVRIDAAMLAETHAASLTPVRAMLYRLVGERLVELRPNEGFRAPQITEAQMRDLYGWNLQVLLLALQMSSHGETPGGAGLSSWSVGGPEQWGVVEATRQLFATVGRRSGNPFCAGVLDSLNDVLHSARRIESGLFPDQADELRAMALALLQDQPGEGRRALSGYHQRRIRVVPEIVRRLHLGLSAFDE